MFKLHPMFSVYNVELFAILQSLLYALRDKGTKFLVCTDSLNELEANMELDSRHPLIHLIQIILSKLNYKEKSVVFCWVPGHSGIAGNERADKCAKAACQKNPVDCQLVVTPDLKALLKQKLKEMIRNAWHTIDTNKLREIKDDVTPWLSSRRSSRREEVV
jgi:ribonuclease HI